MTPTFACDQCVVDRRRQPPANHGDSGRKRDNVTGMNTHDVQQRFDQAADTFDSADFVHARARDGLFARLDPMTLDAQMIVDLGAATGSSGQRLAKRFRRAKVVSIDISRGMLKKVAGRSSWFSKTAAVQADAARLPLADQSVDLVFANLLLPWVTDRAPVFAEVARVLRKDGLFMFSTFGPDTLAVPGHTPFADMHDVGDELLRAGLRDPVLDVDRLTVSWKDPTALQRDLAGMGAGDFAPAGPEVLELDFELVFGHSWGPGEPLAPGVVKVDIGSITKRKR